MAFAGVIIGEERLSAREYIAFLGRTDLGSQYPKEDFASRIEKLVANATISLAARTADGELVGVCFGLTDYAYWLFISDLGVDRRYVNMGIGRQLVQAALKAAGGEKNIIMFTYANKNALPFYDKIGMKPSSDLLLYDKIDWTPFTVTPQWPDGE